MAKPAPHAPLFPGAPLPATPIVGTPAPKKPKQPVKPKE